jgi:hypothetical protein
VALSASSLGARALAAAPAHPRTRREYESRRPKPKDRRFSSASVEARIHAVKRDIADEELAWLFENCFPNTLDTTVDHSVARGRPDTFVITGDIEAMWLRDSSAQVWTQLQLAAEDPALRQLLAGVINRQTKCILIDPYANAFNKEPEDSPWKDDLTVMKPDLHERKWEVDSLCYPMRLAYRYWRAAGDASPFDADWREAMRLALGGDLERAELLMESCFSLWTTWGIEPEQLDYAAMRVLHPAYYLRPEAVESAYYLYRLAGRERYLEMGKAMFDAIVEHTRVETGFTHLRSVLTKEQDDAMESFFLAETLKYAYLLFAPEHTLKFDEVIFSTEAHPIWRSWRP